jgi:hypothetical protein
LLFAKLAAVPHANNVDEGVCYSASRNSRRRCDRWG